MSVLRFLYRCLLLLHPAAFRRRFGEEMLGIFDSSARGSYTAYLLLDAARSLLIQHAGPAFDPGPAAAFRLEVRTSSLTVAQVSQATVLGGALVLLLASLVAQEMPPQSVLVNQPACRELAGPAPQGSLERVRSQELR